MTRRALSLLKRNKRQGWLSFQRFPWRYVNVCCRWKWLEIREGFSNRDLAMVVLRLMRKSSRDFGDVADFRRLSRVFETIQPLQKTLDRPPKAQSVTVNSTSRGRQNRRLSLCASLEALTASDVLIVAQVEKGEFMRSSLDLFRRSKDGKYIWLEAGVDLKEAKLRLQELSASAPGEYLLFDRGTAQIIERFRNDDGSSQ